MAAKKNVEPAVEMLETPEERLENRVLILEQALAKHLNYHFGGILQQ